MPVYPLAPTKAEYPAHEQWTVVETDFLNNVATGLTFSGISGGTTTPGTSSVTQNRPGVLSLQDSATANSGYGIGTNTSPIQLGGGEKFELMFQWADTRTTSFAYGGFRDNEIAGEPVDGAYILMTANASGATAQAVASKASVRTYAPTTFQLVRDTWYRMEVEVNENATEIAYRLFNSPHTTGASPLWEQPITTNLPGVGDGLGFGFVAWETTTSAGAVIKRVDKLRVSCNRRLMR